MEISKWQLAEELTVSGTEVLGYNKSWIDEDYNPDGICLCYKQDDEKPYWVIQKWCGHCDEWHTHYSHEAVHSLEERFGDHDYIDAPTHVILKPLPPTE